MRASRLLSILMLLQTRGRLSAQALGEALSVSVRTIYRDVDHLSASGVPIWAENGRLGGFELKPGWRTQLTGLTVPEARAVFMAGLPGPAAELGLGEAMASAQLKLLAALPEDWRADADQLASCFHLDPADWYHQATPAPHLREVAAAVWNRQRIRMQYESWERVTERDVEPLGLVLKSGSWYMVARSARAGAEPRIHRVAAIQALQRLEERFTPPARFSLAAWWAEALSRFEADVYHGSARVRVTETGLARLAGFSTRVAEAAYANACPCEHESQVETEVPIESVAHAAREM
ncbi:MAG TPA: WYL domain-containing protein, partial [Ideonella sp.]|nr:WYL domain-containing protein [Ideonella sp.]